MKFLSLKLSFSKFLFALLLFIFSINEFSNGVSAAFGEKLLLREEIHSPFKLQFWNANSCLLYDYEINNLEEEDTEENTFLVSWEQDHCLQNLCSGFFQFLKSSKNKYYYSKYKFYHEYSIPPPLNT